MLDPLSSLIHRRSVPNGPVMLMYHAVWPGTGTPDWPWAVSMRRFLEQMDFLVAEGYMTPTMCELANDPTRQWPERTVAITFDDGYADNLMACAALQERRMRATWFIVSGSVGKSPAWADVGRANERLLNHDELREMQQCGMEIGSHTVNHVRLSEISETEMMQELTQSKQTLEDMLGQRVDSFAYPYGAWNEHCADAVKQSGYLAACTTRTGWALRDEDPFRLRRITVFNNDTQGSFARKLCLATHDISWRHLAGYAMRRLAERC